MAVRGGAPEWQELLGAVRRLSAVDDIEEFGSAVLAELSTLVPFDHGVFNEVDPVTRYARFDMHPKEIGRPDWSFETYDNYLPENPIFRHVQSSSDGSARRLSDFVDRAELQELRLYRDILEPLGLQYQVAFSLSTRPPLILAVALSRRARDFSDEEVALLDVLRPHLMRVRRAIVRDTASSGTMRDGLTDRESAVLRLLATGASIDAIASALHISDGTVRKHLEHLYRKLGVTTRAGATARAIDLGLTRSGRQPNSESSSM